MLSFMLKGIEKLLNGSEECDALFLHLRKYYELRYIKKILWTEIDGTGQPPFPSVCLRENYYFFLTVFWLFPMVPQFSEHRLTLGLGLTFRKCSNVQLMDGARRTKQCTASSRLRTTKYLDQTNCGKPLLTILNQNFS